MSGFLLKLYSEIGELFLLTTIVYYLAKAAANVEIKCFYLGILNS